MAILSTVKKGYLYFKTITGYIKVLPKTLASLVEMSDGTTVEDNISELNRNIDYVIEESENENGKYRKWASGILEQWVIKNVTCAINSVYSSSVPLYLGKYYWYYPIVFYEQPEYVICPKAQWDTGASWPCMLEYTKEYSSIRVFDTFSRPETANKLRIIIYAKGKWK